MASVIFMGTPHYGAVILKKLIQHHDVALVVTQPDRPVGRKRTLQAPAVKLVAQEHNIECLQPQKIGKDFANVLKEKNSDYLIVAAYGQMLPQEVLDVATPINLHASLLPQYRGASPVQEMILNGDRYGGVTAMKMELGLDSGPILGYRAFCFNQHERLDELMDLLADAAADLSLEVVQKYEDIVPIEQEDGVATYCKKVKKSDGCIDLDSATAVYAKFRAYYGWPGVHLENGLKLVALEVFENQKSHKAGEIIKTVEDGAVIGCLKGSILVKKVQPAGKKMMDIGSYLNGARLKVGDMLL